MRICFALYDYYPFGGLQEDCLATAVAVAKRGHEVTVITRTWKGSTPDGISTRLLGKKGWSNTSRNDHFFRALSEELSKGQFDGVVAFNRIPKSDIYFAADPCFLERTKHWPWWRKLGKRYRYYAALEASIFSKGHNPETLVLTDREIESFHRYYNTPKEHFHLLPPGVERISYSAEESLKKRETLRAELGVSPQTTVVLFVGSGFRIKGLDRAFVALRENQSSTEDLQFWIVGNGKQTPFQSLIDQAGIPVRFFGGRDEVDRFYAAADFLLHPAYSESAGKVLLEALTHGLPVLTTDTCGYAPHIQKAEAGAVIESPFSQSALNQTVKHFIQKPDKRSTMRENALAYAASEDLYNCHNKASELIESILASNNSI